MTHTTAAAPPNPVSHALDISFGTHLTVALPARLALASGAAHDIEPGLPRSRLGRAGVHRPGLQALLDAAQGALGLGRTRCSLRPLPARTDGQWRALRAWPDARRAA